MPQNSTVLKLVAVDTIAGRTGPCLGSYGLPILPICRTAQNSASSGYMDELQTEKKKRNIINDKPGRAIGNETADRGMTMMMMMMMMVVVATLHCQSIGSLYIDSFRRELVQGLVVRKLDIAIL